MTIETEIWQTWQGKWAWMVTSDFVTVGFDHPLSGIESGRGAAERAATLACSTGLELETWYWQLRQLSLF